MATPFNETIFHFSILEISEISHITIFWIGCDYKVRNISGGTLQYWEFQSRKCKKSTLKFYTFLLKLFEFTQLHILLYARSNIKTNTNFRSSLEIS